MPKRYSKKEWECFLRGRRVAVLGTVGEEGAPALTPIRYLYRDSQILMRTGNLSVKAPQHRPRSARQRLRPG